MADYDPNDTVQNTFAEPVGFADEPPKKPRATQITKEENDRLDAAAAAEEPGGTVSPLTNDPNGQPWAMAPPDWQKDQQAGTPQDMLDLAGFAPPAPPQPSPESAAKPSQPPGQSPFTSPPPATQPPLPAQGAAPGETPPPATPEPPKPPKMLWHAEDGFTPTRAQAEVEKVHQRNLEAIRQGRPGNNEVSRETHDQALRDQEAQQRGLPRDVTLNQTQLDELHRRADQTVKLPRGQRRDIAVAAMAAHFIQQEQHNRERAIEYEMQERHTRAHEMAMAKMDAAKDVRQDKALEAKDARQEKIEIAREKRAAAADQSKLKLLDAKADFGKEDGAMKIKHARKEDEIKTEDTYRKSVTARVHDEMKLHDLTKLDDKPAHLKTPEAVIKHIDATVDERMARHFADPQKKTALAGFTRQIGLNQDGGVDLAKATKDQLDLLLQATEDHYAVGLTKAKAEEMRAKIEKEQKERARVYEDMRTNRMGNVLPTAAPANNRGSGVVGQAIADANQNADQRHRLGANSLP